MSSAIEVILTEDSIAGKAGELIKVRRGYARNYLLPKGLAVFADAYNLAAFAERKAELERVAAEKRQKAEDNKSKLGDDAKIVLSSRAGESGKLFGTITKEDISDGIFRDFQIQIPKQNIEIKFPIKATGEYQINLDLGSQVKSQVTVRVVAA